MISDALLKLESLKKERNAVILAHYYQDPDIQDVADFVGDSLALAQYAVKTDADVILFCGVHFMCETAKILNPDKRVILPDMDAGCSLADSAPPQRFKAWVDSHPDHTVITYINCSAEVKAASNIIGTSSNAEKIINSLPGDKKIIFAPDKYLGAFLQKKTGRDLLLWDGSCQVHEIFSERELIRLKTRNPDGLVRHIQNATKIYCAIQIISAPQLLLLNLLLNLISKNLSLPLNRELYIKWKKKVPIKRLFLFLQMMAVPVMNVPICA